MSTQISDMKYARSLIITDRIRDSTDINEIKHRDILLLGELRM